MNFKPFSYETVQFSQDRQRNPHVVRPDGKRRVRGHGHGTCQTDIRLHLSGTGERQGRETGIDHIYSNLLIFFIKHFK